eukprot:TRINITY_DN1513_c1_g1_i1.p1 TRINITY_DN1513_c1_g1~~TRINITY_DN1513_c1_g1_i1.p1  ORF type:complete len:697 (+),score=307.37 TRINITY_DN1513_c1_g1_i1:123-2213(+)
MDKYQRLRVIGKGSYGQATVVKRKSDGVQLVAKEVKLQGLNAEERKEARAECALLARLQHPNIVQYMEHFEQRQVLYIVMEFAEKGDLDGVLKKYQARGRRMSANVPGLPQEMLLGYFTQICMGLRYLHDKKILHRDIKCANIFLTSNNIVKIGDFGISTILRNTFALARTVCGTPYYFSPELCQNRPYNNKSDVWAVGCVLHQMCTLRPPFEGQNMKQLMQRIVRGTPAAVSPNYSMELRELLKSMLQKNDKMRPNLGQVLSTPIIRGALEKLQQGLGMATVKQQKLPTFKQLLNKHAPKDPRRAGAHADPSPNRMHGAQPRQLVNKDRISPNPTPRGAYAREKEAEKEQKLQAIDKNRVAKWHENKQGEGLNPAGAKAKPEPSGVGHRRRVSAPVSSPSNRAAAVPGRARQPSTAEADRGLVPHGRRKGSTPDGDQPANPAKERAEKEKELEKARELKAREQEYEEKQRKRREAVNQLLLEEAASAGNNSRPSSGGQSPVMHGRRATPKTDAHKASPPSGPGLDALPPRGRSPTEQLVEALADDSSSDEEEPESEGAKKLRLEEYDVMKKMVDNALTMKPSADEDFEDGIDCPPALAPQAPTASAPKFMLGGATLRLDVPQTAPLSQRSEVLREFLDHQVGTGPFVKAYHMISEGDADEKNIAQIEAVVGEAKKDFVPLIIQLAYCDDQINLNQ